MELIICGLLRKATIYSRSHNFLSNYGFLDKLKLRKYGSENVDKFFEGNTELGSSPMPGTDRGGK